MKIELTLIILWLSLLHCHESRSHEYRPRHHGLKKKFSWGMPEFKFPNATARHTALSTGSYIPEKNNIWAIGVWKDKMFVSVFRFGVGVASSLNYFRMHHACKSPKLIPYPSFDVNYVNEDPQHKTVALPSNSSIICGGYFRIDRCNRLWILDAGFVDFFGETPRILTPPALVIFNLKTNKLLLRYTIPAEFVNSNTVFMNLDVDIKGDKCGDAYAYIVDMFRSIVVYSLKKNRSWRLVHNFLGSSPKDSNFFYEGLNFQWDFGVLGITIGECHHDGSRRVYLNPFTSTKSYYISNKVLQNETYIALNQYYYDVKFLGDRGGNGHIYTWAFDKKKNVLFDTQFNRQRIGCWNTRNPFSNSSFATVYKSDRLFYPNDVSIDRHRNLWMLTNNFPIFVFDAWNAIDTNIRIYKAKVDNVISKTVCKHKLRQTE